VTASKGDTVPLIMDVIRTERRDIQWKFNGQYGFNLILYNFTRHISKEHACDMLCILVQQLMRICFKCYTHTITYTHIHYRSKVWNLFSGFLMFLKEVSSAHQGCIYLIKNTVKTVIL